MTRDELIRENLGLVHSCAKKFVNRGIEYDDLYSSGCVGLIKAIDNFDESLGYKLSTYAVPVILGEIKRLFRDGGMIKVSRSLKELSLKASKIAENYKKEHLNALKAKDKQERMCVVCKKKPAKKPGGICDDANCKKCTKCKKKDSPTPGGLCDECKKQEAPPADEGGGDMPEDMPPA